MGEIYCLYSTEDGVPRYVGGTEGIADKRWKKHVADALDLVSGQLYDWMRNVNRDGYYVDFHVLQTRVISTEIEFYELYWKSQFTGLLNDRLDGEPVAASSVIANAVIFAIKTKVALQGYEPEQT